MTLREKLKKIPKGTIVKIGCAGGSGFLYCDEILDELDGVLEKESTQDEKSLKRTMQEQKRTIVNFENHILSVIEQLEDSGENHHLKCKYEFKNYLKKMEEQFDEAVDSFQYVPLSEREVVESYPSINQDSIIILISGVRMGGYWDVEEYRQSK